MPWSYRIEVLREEGPPETIEDNSGKISSALDVFGGGCSVAGGNTGAAGGLILILGVAFLATRRRRKN